MVVRRTLVGQKTFWHLAGARRVPSRYELTSTRLLPDHAALVRTPVATWSDQQVATGGLRARDAAAWDRFADPAATTYDRYVAERAEREIHATHLLRAPGPVNAAWQQGLARALATLRFPRHGLMMAAAYLGSAAPGGRLAIAAAFQAGDEVRHVDRLADRLAQLDPPDDGRARWMDDDAWQPVRRAIEELLVTYDWGEALVALCLAIKPTLDALAIDALAAHADAHHDATTAHLLRSLALDAAWHRTWAEAAIAHALALDPSHRAPLQRWLDDWCARADLLGAGLARALDVPLDLAERRAMHARCTLEAR